MPGILRSVDVMDDMRDESMDWAFSWNVGSFLSVWGVADVVDEDAGVDEDVTGCSSFLDCSSVGLLVFVESERE